MSPLMVRSKKAQKVLNKVNGKPNAMKRKKKSEADLEIERKVNMSDYYRRSYGK